MSFRNCLRTTSTSTGDCWIVDFEPWDFPRFEVRGRLESLKRSTAPKTDEESRCDSSEFKGTVIDKDRPSDPMRGREQQHNNPSADTTRGRIKSMLERVELVRQRF